MLPPFASIQTMGSAGSSQSGNVPSGRYQVADQRSLNKPPVAGVKRPAPSASNATSADSSDIEDDENGELPASGLVAPWEVLRGLADVAIERAAKVGFFRIFSFASLLRRMFYCTCYVILTITHLGKRRWQRATQPGENSFTGETDETIQAQEASSQDPQVYRWFGTPCPLSMVNLLTGGSHQSLPKASLLNPKHGSSSTCKDIFFSLSIFSLAYVLFSQLLSWVLHVLVSELSCSRPGFSLIPAKAGV
jgi:hypothetical protein